MLDDPIIDAAALARLRVGVRGSRGPILPTPEVVLLIDTAERIVAVSDVYAGERLGAIEFEAGQSVHDVVHAGCDGTDCRFLEHWREAWRAHAGGLPVEWVFESHVTGTTSKLRLQPVRYACGILFGDSIECYSDHSVLFIQDLGDTLHSPRAIDSDSDAVRKAEIYQLRRSTDPDPDLVAALDDRLRTATGRLLVSQEAERRRIASEMHDGIGQTLSLLRFEIEGCIERAAQDSDDNCAALKRSYEHAKRALQELRDITRNLRPTVISDLGLTGALELLGADFRTAQPNVQLRVELPETMSSVPDDIVIAVYRIVQEALNNIVRHADAANASLLLRTSNDEILLVVQDDGIGLPENGSAKNGLGLVTMRERAEALGGSYTVSSPPSEGVRIEVRWPAS